MRLLLLVASAVCITIALLLTLGVFSSADNLMDVLSWALGGALAFVLSFFPLPAMTLPPPQ